jgi:hypothetical protein
MRSLSREELACQSTEPRCRIIAAKHARALYPTPQRMLFEIGATLAAALSIAFVGNVLSIWLGG